MARSRPRKPAPRLSAAETTLVRRAEKSLGASQPLPAPLHVQPSFLKGRETVTKFSLFLSKGRTGLGRESTTFHHDGPLFLPWCKESGIPVPVTGGVA